MDNDKVKFDSFEKDKKLKEIEELIQNKDPNIFKILKLEGNEIRHSNFLGWLLDPHAKHGLRESLLKSILVEAGLDNVDSLDYSDVVVEREKDYIDIFVYSTKEKWCLVVENKTWTKDHGNQLNRYSANIKYYFKDYRYFFVYLTPTGEEPTQKTNEEWKCIGYKFIKDAIQEALYQSNNGEKAKIFIEDYIKLLEDDLLMENDKSRRDLCFEVYNRHKEVIDLINQYIGDKRAVQSKLYYDKLAECQGITMGQSSNKYTRFVPNELAPKVDGHGNGWGSDNKYLILYEVETNKNTDELKIQIVLGPAVDMQKRERLIKALSAYKEFANAKSVQKANSKQKYDTSYIWIYEHTIVNKSNYKSKSDEALADSLVEYVESDELKDITNKLIKAIDQVYC